MRFSIYINQKKAVQWKLTMTEASVFSLLYEASGWATEVIHQGRTFYHVSRQLVISEMPLLDLKPDTVYRQFKKLSDKGLIYYEKYKGKDLIRISEKGKIWNKFDPRNNSDLNPKTGQKEADFVPNSDLNPDKLGSESENNSDLNPTYQNTNIDKNTIDQTSPCASAREEEISYKKSDPVKEKKDSAQKKENVKPIHESVHYPAALARLEDEPWTPEEIRVGVEEIWNWAQQHGKEIDLISQEAKANVHAMKSITARVLKRYNPVTHEDLRRRISLFLDRLPDFYADRFDLILIIRKIATIFNEIDAPKKNQKGKGLHHGKLSANPSKYKSWS